MRNVNKKLRKKLSRYNVSKQTFTSGTQTDETSLYSSVSNFTLNNVDPPKTTSDDSSHVKNIPRLPSWSLKNKMSFFHSKQDYIKTTDTEFMNTTQEDTCSNPLLDRIFHFLCFFLLSSLLCFQLNFITLFTTLSFHVMAGFCDPAYFNNIFIGVGTVIGAVFSWGNVHNQINIPELSRTKIFIILIAHSELFKIENFFKIL